MINISNEKSIKNIISLEQKSLSATMEIQKTLNKQVLLYMKNILGNLDFTSEVKPKGKLFDYLNNSTDTLSKSNENLLIIEELLDELTVVEKDYRKKNVVDNYNTSFTKKIKKLYTNTKKIEDFLHTSSITNFDDIKNEIKAKTSKKEVSDQLIESEEINDYFVEDTLIISEINKKVILPYKIDDLKKYMLDNPEKYKTLNNVIDILYTKPLKQYKPAASARFRETYRLIKNREHKSNIKAFSLAMELFGNYNLHPAVISACKNLDELDIYLACLEDNSLNDFTFFNVKFEVPPAKQSKKIKKTKKS